MWACQAMTAHGGWPMNAFLPPERQPSYAGTYFPPEPRHGMPSWRMVLLAVADAWEKRRDDVRRQGAQLVSSLGATARLQASSEPIRAEALQDALSALRSGFDRVNGGFGGAPKFPPVSVVVLLLARCDRDMSVATLRSMAQGGIYEQVGVVFARYAVDAIFSIL